MPLFLDPMKTLVLGIGNILLSDEGIGIHTLNYLRTHYAHLPAVEYLDGGTLSFTLIPYLENVDHLIVIDATQLQDQAGTVGCFVDIQFDEFINTSHASVHEISLLDILTMLRLTDHLPKRRALVGIQPQKLTWGNVPTPRVEQAIPQAARLVEQLIREWHQ